MRNLILSVLAIGFITMYFLGNIRVGFIVTSLVVLTEVSIVAFMPIWGIKLDTGLFLIFSFLSYFFFPHFFLPFS